MTTAAPGPLTVGEAVAKRISTRAFLPDPVPETVVREILDAARRAPSGGNLQPWTVHAVAGAARNALIARVQSRLAEDPFANEGDVVVYPPNLWAPFRDRRYAVGEQMYDLLGIPREDKAARLAHLARNYEFFGAPVGLFFSLDRRFDRGQWAHLGMFMQTIALLAVERGLATCMQEAWSVRARTVAQFLGLPQTHTLYCGMALGRADETAPVNQLRSERADVDAFTTFMGFE